MSVPASVISELQKLTPTARVELIEIDSTVIGGGIMRYHAGRQVSGQPIHWQGNAYTPFPLATDGWGAAVKEAIQRPKLRLGNVLGTITSLCLAYGDLVGSMVSRKTVMAKFLDGMPDANPLGALPDEVYFINQKTSETPLAVEFELVCQFDLEGVKIPRRIVTSMDCSFKYRGADCGFTGLIARAFSNDQPTYGMRDGDFWAGTFTSGRSYPSGALVGVVSGGYTLIYRCLAVSPWTSAADSSPWTATTAGPGLFTQGTTYHAADAVFDLDQAGTRRWWKCLATTTNAPENHWQELHDVSASDPTSARWFSASYQWSAGSYKTGSVIWVMDSGTQRFFQAASTTTDDPLAQPWKRLPETVGGVEVKRWIGAYTGAHALTGDLVYRTISGTQCWFICNAPTDDTPYLVAAFFDLAHAGTWFQVQRYCGVWTQGTDYVAGDVVSVRVFDGRYVFYVANTPTGSEPPGAAWDADQCSRRLKGCICRFGDHGASLPTGMFPGTETYPQMA